VRSAWCFGVLCLLATVAAGADPEFSDERVGKAIEKGAAFLLSKQNADGSWPDTQGGLDFVNKDRQIGLTSLVTYCLLAKGVLPDDPRMAKAIKWLDEQETRWTYALALRCQVWLELSKRNPNYRVQLGRDARPLLLAVDMGKKKKGSYGYRLDNQGSQAAESDNSNAQYAVLGAWAAFQMDIEIPNAYWKLVMQHWMGCQQGDGGWKYKDGDPASTGSMTTAGLATTFLCVDALMSKEFTRCKRSGDIQVLRKGLDWFDKNYVKTLSDPKLCTGGHGDVYYYLFGVERVGLACGYKYFGQVDWYQRGAVHLVKSQGPNGAWNGNWGENVATAYALLFLVRGQGAVLFNWLEYEGDWNNRPRALANYCRWARPSFEKDVNWQIINLKVDVSEWHDAPIVLITGSEAPKFSDDDLKKLRTYVHQGGTLLSIDECNGAAFKKAIREVYGKLFPEYEMKPLGPEHDLYNLNNKVAGQVNFFMVSNGVRPLAIHTENDMTLAWQLNNRRTAAAMFEAGANIVFYVTDRRLRNRGAFRWPDKPNAAGPTVKVARLKYTGNYDPEPLAWERFSRDLGARTGVKLEVAGPMEMDKLAGAGAALAAMTGTSGFRLNDAEKAALKAFVEKGGTLLVDAAGGDTAGGKSFAESATAMIDELFGRDNLKLVSARTEWLHRKGMDIERVRYSRSAKIALGAMGARDMQLRAITLNGRQAVLFSRQDLTTGLLAMAPYGCAGLEPPSAYELVRNIVLYAGKVPEKTEEPATKKADPATKKVEPAAQKK
jgi:hypothetical protein